MGLLGFYTGFLKLHSLRKKSIILLLLIALALIVLCLQYSTTVRSEAELRKEVQDFQDRRYNDIIGIGDLFQKPRGKSVQFLMVTRH